MFRWPSRAVLDRSRKLRLIVTVTGTITDYEPDQQDESGTLHQILVIRVEKLDAAGRQPDLEEGQEVHVAIRYGDPSGLEQPIAGLTEGAPIEMQGAFISAEEAYEQEDGRKLAVIHFTHRPLGWVKYQGKTYR
ncbi:MAG TPA: hypothetical protein VNT75_14920 [Symbiobacteriaceae bacterium]|nr:hypothetical protein [Symbiobacteriaceae bacterium]